MPKKEHWVEAEEWLAYHYPEYTWEVLQDNKIIVIDMTCTDGHFKIDHFYQDMFKDLVREFGFDHAMRIMLNLKHFIPFTNTYHKPE